MAQIQQYRMAIAAGALAVGLLQAWDANALQAGAAAQTLIAIAVILPAAAIALSSHPGLGLAAVVVGAVLLTCARMIAPVPMNTLHLAIFAPALFFMGSSALGLDGSRIRSRIGNPRS